MHRKLQISPLGSMPEFVLVVACTVSLAPELKGSDATALGMTI